METTFNITKKIFRRTLLIKAIILLIFSAGFVQCGESDSSSSQPEDLLKLTAQNPNDEDQFGYSVSISGDYAIVGSPGEDNGGPDRGAAYVFHRMDANTWDTGTKISALGAQDNDAFGAAVSISGDYAIVGSPGRNSSRGAIYIFYRTGLNTWDFKIMMTRLDFQVGDRFGFSVSISGDYAIVGSPGEDNGGPDRGTVYIIHRTDLNIWDMGDKITAYDPQDNDEFGRSVSISGDQAIVGAPFEDNGGTDRGTAYIFY